jgi:hypothetical protein
MRRRRGQNKFIQINDCKENLSYIISRMNLKLVEAIKTETFYWVEFHIRTEPNANVAHRTQNLWFTGGKQTVDDV